MNEKLQQIAEKLKNNWATLENPGLWHGKMGIVIFFFHYARYSGEKQYEDYAEEIIESLQVGLNWDSPVDYENGLAGIGVGIEYLSQNGFIEIFTDEILEDIDKYIQNFIIEKKHENNSFGKGICGFGQYLLFRLNNSITENNELRWLLNHERMLQIVDIFENEILLPNEIPETISLLCNVHKMNICNLKTKRCLYKMLETFSIDDIYDEFIPFLALALLRLKSTDYQITEHLNNILERAIKATETIFASTIKKLLWLLQCKRLISQNKLNISFMSRINTCANEILNQMNEMILSESNELSLNGYAGAGLAIMTLSEKCDGAWLDLLM